MRRDFGIDVPLLDEDDTPETYFAKFSDLLGLKKRWTIRRRVALTFLSFGKFLMYRDLDPNRGGRDRRSIADHPLVRELFEGIKKPNFSLAEEYPIDEPSLKKDVPLLIRDADSSQHSALIHALRGKNLVIEGPPGTGKSQTITNLIAAVLAQGKTVLFVSEKLAALEVVRNRLDEVGLGIFCLELHSHKTRKGALLNDIALRVSRQGSFREPRELDNQLVLTDQKKHALTTYASLINRIIQPIQATVFDILWARDQSGQQIVKHRDLLEQIFLPHAKTFSKPDIVEMEEFATIYGQTLEAALENCDSLEQHPWAWVTVPLLINEEAQVFNVTSEILLKLGQAEQCLEMLGKKYGVTITKSISGLKRADTIFKALPKLEEDLLYEVLTPCIAVATRVELGEFVSHVETYRASREHLTSVSVQPDSFLDPQVDRELAEALECLKRWKLEEYQVAELLRTWKIASESAKLLEGANSAFCVLLGILDSDVLLTHSTIGYLLEFVRVLESAPFELLHLRSHIFEREQIKPMLQSAKREAKDLKEEAKHLQDFCDLTLGGGMYTPVDLLRSASEMESASFWQRLFGKEYRKSVKTYLGVTWAKKKLERNEMARSLRFLAAHIQRRRRFESDESLCTFLGTEFKGIESAWEDLDSILQWYEQLLIALPDHKDQAQPFREILTTARVERLRAVKLDIGRAQDSINALQLINSHIADFASAVPGQLALIATGSFETIYDSVRALDKELGSVLDVLAKGGVKGNATIKHVLDALPAARRCRESKGYIWSVTHLHAILGRTYNGVDTEVAPVKRTLGYVEKLAACKLSENTLKWLLCEEHEKHLKQLSDLLRETSDCGERLRMLLKELDVLAHSTHWTSQTASDFSELQSLIEKVRSNPEGLAQWNALLKLRLSSTEKRIKQLTDLADSQKLPPTELAKAYRFVLFNSLSRQVLSDHAELQQATGIRQDELRRQFAIADKESIRLYSEKVAAIIDKRPTFSGRQTGPVRNWTDMALLLNELNKQKRHIPIRQLIRRAPNALLSLKPCFMMGPLSVAQYLEPEGLKFDLVVMDEASQLKPEDAIGAIARGTQVVIVGDPKQLPPTTFFQRSGLETEDGEGDDGLRSATEEQESILDVACTLYQPVRRLRWHYRSRHHSLIAFSNEEFYQRDLIIFPTAYHDDPSLGIKYNYIADGIFENGRNAREAAVVVDAVLEHMRNNLDESLGVVTMNFEQCELIEELLDRKLREDPFAVAYQERMKGGFNSLFVKNLENVQGDERDVIFISTTYGPDARGNPYQRFGPITHSNGHRRLNVLFTRAKKRVVVFSSLDPDRIQIRPETSLGVRALKGYLTYARSGILQQADDGAEQPTNDFERSVGSVLKELGFECVPQVGVAGFFIDLGVKHPTKPGTFILGIECDGASYHSGRSARDRDRLRQEILENLGWRIHRIWSTDWYKNREGAIRKLGDYLQSILEKDTDYLQHCAAIERKGSLKQRLEKLRDNEIDTEFSGIPANKRLLSDELMKFFIEKRPKTRDDWFRRAPLELRMSVDSRQVARYLDRVLSIIAEE
jgi:very-short-patch-repair endonuclease